MVKLCLCNCRPLLMLVHNFSPYVQVTLPYIAVAITISLGFAHACCSTTDILGILYCAIYTALLQLVSAFHTGHNISLDMIASSVQIQAMKHREKESHICHNVNEQIIVI